jgi:hypothetical protein
MLPQIPVWQMRSRGLSSPLNSSRLSDFSNWRRHINQSPSLPSPANQSLKWEVFRLIFGNQGRCLSSEVLAGTLQNFHSPELHVFGVSPTTHLYTCCFSQIIVLLAPVTGQTPCDQLSYTILCNYFRISGITINDWRTAYQSCCVWMTLHPSALGPWVTAHQHNLGWVRFLYQLGNIKISYRMLVIM